MLAGLGAGTVAALVLGRALSSFLYGVTPADPVTFATVAALLATAVLAGFFPAGGPRADPVRALRVD